MRPTLASLLAAVAVVLALSPADGPTTTYSLSSGGLFGDGSDGAILYSASTVDSPIDAAASGAVGGTTLTASNQLFAAGDKILIHQSQMGGEPGAWEINEIQSYALGTIITVSPLAHTYSTGAQVVVVPQYSSLTVNAGVTLSAKAWNGSTGGILAVMVNGTAKIAGVISAKGRGYRGGFGGANKNGWQGEGWPGTGSQGVYATPNGNGGGGSNQATPQSGGGGGNGTAGDNSIVPPGDPPSVGGQAAGTVELTRALFGGGGGGSSGSGNGGTTGVSGGTGGGVIFVFAAIVTMNSGGTIDGSGGNGNNGAHGSGGGAGGSIFIASQSAAFGTGTLQSVGGVGGLDIGGLGSTNENGGPGGIGRIRVEYCTFPSGGSASPPASLAPIPACADTDQDGCMDKREVQTTMGSEFSGGLRNPAYFWDFYDVWTRPDPVGQPALWTRDKAINVIGDILGVAQRFGSTRPGGAPTKAVALAEALATPASPTGYHADYDRGLTIGPNPWNLAGPDGAINVLNDILGVARQFGHNCN